MHDSCGKHQKEGSITKWEIKMESRLVGWDGVIFGENMKKGELNGGENLLLKPALD